MAAARRWLALALLGALAAPAAAQAPAWRVVVRDAAGGQPVAQARVDFVAGGRGGMTGPEGTLALRPRALPDTLLVTALGFRPLRVAIAAWPEAPLHLTLTAMAPMLEELVVSGSRREQRAAEVAMPVIVAGREEVAAQGATAVDQVVQELPGVQALPTPPAGSTVSIRGLGDARVLVLVDGEPAPGALLDNRDLSRLSTLHVDRIEVVKGPHSALHGSDALGGVINVITEAPDGPLRLDLRSRAGDLGRREAAVAAVRGGRLALRGSAGVRQQDRVPGIIDLVDAFERTWDASGSVRYRLSDATQLRADGRWFQERQRWEGTGGFNQFTDTWAATAFVEATGRVGEARWRVRTAGQEYQYRFRQARGLDPIANSGAPPQRERVWRTTVGGSAPLLGQVVDAGVDVGFRDVQAADRLVGAQLGDRMAEAYVQSSVVLGPVLVTPAGRVTHNSRWGTALTPSLAVAWEPAATLRLRGNASRGFRGPTFKELGWTFANLQGGYVLQGTPTLRPERSWQLAVGATWAAGGGVAFEADIFRNDVKDLIDLTAGGQTPAGLLVFAPRNVSEARTEGVEVGARLQRGWLTAAGGYEYLRAVDRTTGVPLNRRATHAARLRLTGAWRGPRAGRLDVTLRYTGAAPILGNDAGPNAGAIGAAVGIVGTQGAFAALDLHGQVSVLRGLAIDAGVDNVLDDRPSGLAFALPRRAYVGLQTTLVP
ncbi:MAG: TonB-dependent receptor [Gemmatimonadales bacterium]|nr:TonB-dependent receptor [Gemmatimonadales bacterium]